MITLSYLKTTLFNSKISTYERPSFHSKHFEFAACFDLHPDLPSPTRGDGGCDVLTCNEVLRYRL